MTTLASRQEATLRAPIPYFGGKYRAAPLIWRAFGNVPNFVDPFMGSLAVLLARPGGAGKVETVNDRDGLVSNFWRATRDAPAKVARWTDWPVNEADLHARHRWLVGKAPKLYEKLLADPDYYDAKIAGWWAWGISTWIGNGWCHQDVRVAQQQRRPVLCNANGHGVHVRNSARPDLSALSGTTLHKALPNITIPGNGIHAPSRKMPRNARGATQIHKVTTGKKPKTGRATGVNSDARAAIYEVFEALALRLRDVRICCGDWTRVLGRSTLGIDTAHGMTPCGILLDPPYSHALRDKRLYREDEAGCSDKVREWALEHGDNPALRIALCGFVGEHEMPSSWREVAWRENSTHKTSRMERIWFSRFCLEDKPVQGSLVL